MSAVPVKPLIDYSYAMEEETIAERVESLANVELRLHRDIAFLGRVRGTASDSSSERI